MSDIAIHLQAIRKIKPFIEAFGHLVALGERAEKIISEEDAARQRLNEARELAQRLESEARQKLTHATNLEALAKDEAHNLVNDATAKAEGITAEAEADAKLCAEVTAASYAAAAQKIDENKQELATLQTAIAEREEQLRLIDERLAAAQALIDRAEAIRRALG